MTTLRVRCRDCGGQVQVKDGEMRHVCDARLRAMEWEQIRLASDQAFDRVLRDVGKIIREQQGA